ncbi:uncharacterized protein [Miscanthus floridulus]|uniref:uncharacterized protein n=1 Tax=Miscanthus floridulus TaxID=154761 RepID=UPI003459232E
MCPIMAHRRCREPSTAARPASSSLAAAWRHRLHPTTHPARGGALESAQGNRPPKFHKIEFTTYDGSVDPLHWLTHCEQFFHGQLTLASQRTWMASYHLTGDAQTWYYALEQDEGQPPWDRFKDLCRLRFGPPIRGTRLAELGRLPFHSTVDEFTGRFQAVLAHARDISTRQKAELFVGGLPDHLRVDSSDYIDDDTFTGAEAATDTVAEDPTTPPDGATANALVVSVYALAGIRTYHTMLLPVTINREHLLALLDTGSTHTFLQSTVMRRLGIVPHGGNNLRVTVANGEHLSCEGIARDLPVLIGGESFPITCVGLTLGCFDFILGVDFLGALGPLLWDLEGLTVSFQRGDQRVMWQCMGAPGASTHQQHLATTTPDQQRPLLDQLLQQHGAIFDEPCGLPPRRTYDHRIHLLPGTAPVAVRPYRYP